MTELHASSADGRTVTALDDGSGPNLLVVHPGGGDATAWDNVARRLTNDFRVVRVHRRIYAPGADIALPHSMAMEAADVLAVAEVVGSPMFLVGHSSGAVAALEAAVLAPASFAGLFLYEPPCPPVGRSPERPALAPVPHSTRATRSKRCGSICATSSACP